MSKYTINIKNLVKNGFDFGLNNYPIFDEDYREILNKKILDHYYMDEIGLETPELFKFFLNQKMLEIMPYYNELYLNQKKVLDKLLDNVNLEEKYTRNSSNNGEVSSISQSNNNTKTLYQNTPQSSIVQVGIDDQKYATDLTLGKNNANSSDNSTSIGNSTEVYIRNLTGNTGVKYNIDIINDIKNNILNIDMLIINELEELFMGIF